MSAPRDISDLELVMVGLSLLLCEQARVSDDEDFGAAAVSIAMRLNARTADMAAARIRKDAPAQDWEPLGPDGAAPGGSPPR